MVDRLVVRMKAVNQFSAMICEYRVEKQPLGSAECNNVPADYTVCIQLLRVGSFCGLELIGVSTL